MKLIATTGHIDGNLIAYYDGMVQGIGIGPDAWWDAYDRMVNEAKEKGANGIIGIRYDSVFSPNSGVIVHVAGTAVKIRE